MAGRDEWFAIHASGPAGAALEKGAGAKPLGGAGFLVEPEAAPLVRAGFEAAIQEMTLAKRAARDMQSFADESVNPVVDKYMAALIDRATGDEGSVVMAADSAIAAYQDVIDQLDASMAATQADDDTAADPFRQQS